MTDKVDLLCELYQAKFDRLKEMASVSELPKNGPVEIVRARLIKNLVLTDWDLSKDNIRSIKNKHLGEILGVFGLKNLVQSENADRDCTYTYMKTLNNLLRKI